MPEFDLGRARGRIELDAKGARKGLQQAGADADKFRGKMAGAAPQMRRAGAAMAGAGFALAAGIGLAVKVSADFEAELSKVEALGGTTEEQMEQLSEVALRIGRDTSFGAAQAAGAMVELRKAGIDTTDIINGAADATVALAEAGELDVPNAASIMAAAMNTFGIAAEDASKVADIMAGAANASATDVAALGESLQQVGATASTLNIPLEDVNTALAALANRGITGGKAGTTLNRMLLNLQPASAKAASTMEELGLITADGTNQFFDAEGKLKSLSEVSGLLQDSLAGLSDQQRVAALETIFGSRAIAAASALAEGGAESFDELKDSVTGIDAADVAAAKLDNLQGSMTILKGTIETFLIGAGAPLQGMLKGLVDNVTGFINRLSKLDPRFQKAAIVGAALAAVLLTLGGGLLIILGILPALAAGFGIMTGTILPVVLPILAVIAALAALGIGIKLLWERSQTFRDIVMGVWEAIQQAVQAVVDWFMGEAMPFIMQTWAQIQEVFQAAVQAIVAIVTWFVGVVRGFWTRFGEHIISAAKNFLGFIAEFFRATWENIKQVIEAVLRVIKGIFDVFAGIFTGDWNRVWEGIKAIFSGIWSAIHAVFSQIVATIIGVAKTFWTVLETGIGAAMAAISQIWSGAWNAIKTFFSNIWEHIKSAISEAFNSLKERIAETFDAIVAVGGDILQFFIDLPGNILDALGNLGEVLVEAGKDLIRGLIKGIGDMAKSAANAVGGVVSDVKGAVTSGFGLFSPSKLFREYGQDTFKGFVLGIEAMARDVAKAAELTAGAAVGPSTGLAIPLLDGLRSERTINNNRSWAPTIHNEVHNPSNADLVRASERSLRIAAVSAGVRP